MVINHLKEQIDSLYEHMLYTGLAPESLQLEYVYRGYCQLYDKMSAAENCLKKRQFLTELHIAALPLPYKNRLYSNQMALPLYDHEQYHEVSEILVQLTRDFFREAKTFLNDFTRYYSVALPESKCRAVSFGSFGKCVNKCNDPACLSKLEKDIQCALEPFTRKGLRIDSTICQYRDKYIEHSYSLTYPELLTGPSQLQLVHMRTTNTDNPPHWAPISHRSEEEERQARAAFIPLSDTVFLEDKLGEIWAYFHVNQSSIIPRSFEKLQSMGEVTDSTNLHFKKYGPHFHIFPPARKSPPPQNQSDYDIYSAENFRVLGMSPNAITSIILLSAFFYDGLKHLQFYLRNHQ